MSKNDFGISERRDLTIDEMNGYYQPASPIDHPDMVWMDGLRKQQS